MERKKSQRLSVLFQGIQPKAEDKIQRSLLQTLLDKSLGTQSTAEPWFGPSISFFARSAGSLTPFKGRKSDSQTKKKSFFLHSGCFP